jgi:hypothetical protein
MKRIKEEAEVIVRLDYETQTAHICVSAWPAMAAKMDRLYGRGKDHDSDDCARRWEIPLKAVSFRKADAKRKLSPERMAALKAGRAKGRATMPILAPADHNGKEDLNQTPLGAVPTPNPLT